MNHKWSNFMTFISFCCLSHQIFLWFSLKGCKLLGWCALVVMSNDLPCRAAKQQVRGAGRTLIRGLFASRDISGDNEFICDFHISGIFEDERAASDNDVHYVLKAGKEKFMRCSKIDGRYNFLTKYDNKIASLANHASSKNANAKICVNQHALTACLRSCKRIRKGERILVNYGQSKWSRGLAKHVRKNRSLHPNLCQGHNLPKKRKI